MADPLAQIVSLLQPDAAFAKRVSGSGPWRFTRTQSIEPYFCAVIEGVIRYEDRQGAALCLEAGDFILIPSGRDFVMSSEVPSTPRDELSRTIILPDGEYRLGVADGPMEMRGLAGYCVFRSTDAVLLASLLPQLVVVRGERRLAQIMHLLREETVAQKPGRDVVLQHLLEVLLIEALRSTAEPGGSPGLLRGLEDERLAAALRAMHARPDKGWTVAELAREAALSRSGFHERFQNAVGMAPMEYLLAWRLALAKDLLRKRDTTISQIAGQVGYRSASAFSVAFIRHVGVPPARFARDAQAIAAQPEMDLTSAVA